MLKGKPLWYIDSCVFLSWLGNEELPDNEMQGVLMCLTAIEKKEAYLVVSVVYKTEVLAGKIPPATVEEFERFMSRKNVSVVDVDARISDLSRELREYYIELDKQDGGKQLGGLDAIHLATAIHYEADAFYTFDKGGEGARRTRSLLSLNGNVAGHPLVVCKPPVKGQLRLEYGTKEETTTDPNSR